MTDVSKMRIIVPKRVSIMACADGLIIIIDRDTPKEFGFFLTPDTAKELAGGLKEEAEYFVEKNDGSFERVTVTN